MTFEGNAFERVHTIAIAAHKGGVGKTTTAMALAVAIAQRGRLTLLVDLDPQGHSTIGLGVEAVEGRTVRELLAEDPIPLEGLQYPTHASPGLYLVPATIKLERLARTLPGRMFREAILQKALAPARKLFDCIVIDCPPSLGVLVENALVAATEIIVPCRSEARGLDGVVDLLEVLELLNPAAHARCRILRTLRHGARTNANALLDQALAEDFPRRLLATVIPQCDDLNHAQTEHVDIFSYAPKSTGAAAYAQLAEEVTALWAAPNSSV